MWRFARVVFVIVVAQLLFITPIILLIKVHTKLYGGWAILSQHTSSFFTVPELTYAQKFLMDNLFYSLPSFLTFTEREILHIQDITFLIIGIFVYFAALLAILAVLIFSKNIRNFFITKSFRIYISFIVFSSVLVVTTSIYFSFDKLFIFLHKLIFNNEYWLLANDALLINIYPPQFFKHMMFFALTFMIIFYIITVAISYSLEKKYGNII